MPSLKKLVPQFVGFLTVVVLAFGLNVAPAQAATMRLTPVPTITGYAKVGETLTAVAGTWDSGVSLTYKWNRGGNPIAGATTSSYPVIQGDYTQTVSVTVTGTKAGFTTVSKTSASTAAIAAQTSVTVAGIVYSLDGAGAAYVYGVTSALATTATILASVTIGGATYSVTSLNSSSFANNASLVSITIPASVTSIGASAFFNDTSLTSMTFLGAQPTGRFLIFNDPTFSKPVVYYSSRFGSSAVKGGFQSEFFNSPTRAVEEPLTLTPTPTITGTATVGKTLTAVAGAWDSGVTFGYQWNRNGVAITGAKSATYVLTGSDLAALVTVAVTGSKKYYVSTPKTSAATTAVATGTLALTPTPTITGTAALGATLTGATGSWEPGASLKYQWNRNGAAITAATRPTYLAGVDDVDKTITFTVTATKVGYTTVSKTSTATAPVAAGTLTLTPTPTITGTAIMGATLTAVADVWDDGVTLSYSWLRSGVAIAGAIASTYELTVADIGKFLSVVVTGTKAGYTTTNKTSENSSQVAAATLTLAPTPMITGTTTAGKTLTAVAGDWDSGVTLSYQWNRGGDAIAGATSAALVLTPEDIGADISVTVTGTKAGYTTTNKTSESSGQVAADVLTLTPAPTITGTATAGKTLTAVAGDWDSGVTLSYQWNRGGDAIAGATSATLVLTPEDIGADISVTVTGSKLCFTTVSLTSDATSAVVEAQTSVTINGVIYTMNAAGAAYVSGHTGELGSDLSIESSVTIDGAKYAVTSIGYYAFLNANSLVLVVVPDSVTAIFDSAFDSATSLVSISLPNSLTYIGGYAFYNAASLASLTVPKSVTYIGLAAFAYDYALTSVTFAGAAPAVGYYAFYGTTTTFYFFSRFGDAVVAGGFTTPTWADQNSVAVDEALTLTPAPTILGLASVGETLTAVAGDWDSGVTLSYQWNRGGDAIAGATNATFVLTPADFGADISVTVFGSKPCYTTSAQTSTATPTITEAQTSKIINGVIYTMDGAGAAYVSGHTGELGSDLSIESSVTIAGVTYAVTSIGYYAFLNANSLVSVVIPDSVTAIFDDAFDSATSLVSISLPNSLTYIGGWAFYNAASLASLTVPKSVTYIGWAAFAYDYALTSVTFAGAAPALGDYAFYGTTTTFYFFSRFSDAAVAGGFTTPTWADQNSVSVDEAMTLTPVPSVSGLAIYGQTLTAAAGDWDYDVSLSYQWNRGGDAIAGATDSTFVLSAADIGADISVTVTGSRPYYATTSKTSLATAAVLAAALTLTPTPEITGTTTVGQALTAVAGRWDDGVSFSYQWNRGGDAIAGATAATYALKTADLGAVMSVTVTGSKLGFTTVAKTSSATAAVVRPTLKLTPTPTITGDPYVGMTLTAVTGAWDSGVALTYVWSRSGVAITGATAGSYTLVAADLAKTLTVTVTGSKADAISVSKTSLATAAIAALKNLQAASTPSILGDLIVASTLTVNLNQWDSGVAFSYQWNRNGVAIGEATSKTYVLASADFGQVMTVTVTGSKLGYSSVSKTSSKSSAVRAATFTKAPTPTITGVAKVGSLLTANVGTWDAGVTLSYQWKRWGTAIVGATGSTYALVAGDLRAQVCVTVVATKTGYVTATKTSALTTAVAAR